MESIQDFEIQSGWSGREAQMELIFLQEDIPADGTAPEPALAIGRGFEISHSHTTEVGGEVINWTERLLVVRSFSYVQSLQAASQRRLDKAEAALRALTPPRHRGKRQFQDKASLVTAIERIEKQYDDEICSRSSYSFSLFTSHQ
jgi:hypothetical protein